MLSIIDASLSQSMNITRSYDNAAVAHVLTGLEPFGMLELRKKGFKGGNPMLKGSRASILTRAIHEVDSTKPEQVAGNLPSEISEKVKAGTTLSVAVAEHIAQCFGDMIMLQGDKIGTSKPLDNYGMDSMLAAEFRAWLFKTFRVDVPFLQILSKVATIGSLSAMVVNHMQEAK